MGEVKEVLAFEVEVDRVSSIVFAATEKSARMKAVLAYWEVGYGRQGEWPPGVRSRRRPFYDRSPQRLQHPGKCWREEYVRAR
jgi:hypothetical protein